MGISVLKKARVRALILLTIFRRGRLYNYCLISRHYHLIVPM